MTRSSALLGIFLMLGACGGGGGGLAPGTPVAQPPPAVQSPGGQWFHLDADTNPVHFYISEDGEVRSIFHAPAVTEGPTFGAGSVSVAGTDTVSGVLQARGIQPSSSAPTPVDLSCTLSGTVRERQSLSLRVICSETAGIVFDESFLMTLQPGYEDGSSLDAIAGNYTLAFRPDTNTLNITADGTLFGMYHNGANCTVNGTSSIIDVNFSFIDIRWTMSNCTDPFGIWEGVEMTGFAMPGQNPSDPPGSYYFILTGQTSSGLRPVSVTYDPV